MAGGSVLRAIGVAPLTQQHVQRRVRRPPPVSKRPAEPVVLPAIIPPEPVDDCTRLARGGGALHGIAGLPNGGLHRAASTGDIARILQDIELGADKDQLDEHGRTPLAWAVLRDQRDAAISLLRNGAHPDARLREVDFETALILAARTGSVPVIDALLRGGAVPSVADSRQRTALMIAAWTSHAAAVDVLAQQPGTLELTNESGMTALHFGAAGTFCIEPIEALLKHGAVIDARDHAGATPLLHALERGHVDVASFLIKKGADVNARDFKGRGALDYVVSPRRLDPANSDDALELVRLKDALQLLIGWQADRRLGLDPRTQPILFREELNELAAREGRPRLPDLEGQTQASGSTASKAVERAGRRLFRKLEVGSMRGVAQLPDALLFNRGWSRVPAIVRSAVLRSITPRGGQRLVLSGGQDGRTDWALSDVLLIESMAGTQRRSVSFLGAADEVRLNDARVARLGRYANHFLAGEIDVTETLSTDRGADRIVISALDYGGGFSMSDIYLNVEGSGAGATADRFEIEQQIAGRAP